MPGIVGIITQQPREWTDLRFRKMLEVLRHRPFYSTGTWSDSSSGVYAGWTVHEGAFADGMPLRSERGDAVLIFSGEEYPEPGTAAELRRKGHSFDSGNASYLVHLAEEHREFPKNLNGRFHGLLFDQSNGKVLLFNDRFGMHRLYYHQSKDAFYFAVEAKAILAACPELRTADVRGLGEFVSTGCVLENRTIFKGIFVLPPGSAWTFQSGQLKSKGTYFDPREWENQSPLDSEAYYSEIRRTFSENLPRYLQSRQRIGMSLTGGLDTRMVMAWQKFAPGAFPCYTYGGSYRESRDVIVARKVAKTCQQPHQVLSVHPEFIAQFPRYAEQTVYLTDGCVDVYRSPDLYLSEKARLIAPVRMTGLYGDEVLRHLRAFKPTQPMDGLYSRDFSREIEATKKTYAQITQCNPTSFAVFRQAPWHHFGILALEQTQLAVRTPYLDNDFVRTVFRAPASASENNDLRVRMIGDGSEILRRIRTDRGFGGNSNHLSSATLRLYQEFTYKAEYAYDYGMPQWLSRVDHAFAAFHLERLFLGRHKLYHFRVWYRDALSKYVKETLFDPRTLSRPYIERKGVESVVQGHLSGKRNYTNEIHRMLSLELIHRLFLDAN